MLRSFGLFTLLVVAFLPACRYYISKDPSSDDPSGATGAEPGFAVPTFAYVQAQVFQPYCVTCHSSAGGNPGGVNLETYSSTIQNLTNIDSAAIISQIMPPSHPIPSFAQDILKEWIDGGGPLNGVVDPLPGGSPSPEPSPTPTPAPTPPVVLLPTYTSLAQNIFTPKCISCHGAGGSESSKPLDSYQAIVGGGWVTAGNPSGSTLYNEISAGKMPPKNPLTQAEIQAVSAWISGGALNN